MLKYLPPATEDHKSCSSDHSFASFSNSSFRGSHVQNTVASAERRTKWNCSVCNLSYKTQWGLKLNMGKQHFDNPRFRCHLCDHGFTMRDQYEGHMNMHNNVKAFCCPKCPKAFAHKTSLRAHMRDCSWNATACLPLHVQTPHQLS